MMQASGSPPTHRLVHIRVQLQSFALEGLLYLLEVCVPADPEHLIVIAARCYLKPHGASGWSPCAITTGVPA